MTQHIERKYTLRKVKAGDYLMIGNDDKTLWRISTYEDGPSNGVESMERDRKFWGVWKWESPITLGESAIEIENWDRWDAWDLSHYGSREEAIQATLRMERRRNKPKPPSRKDSRPIGQILVDAYAKDGAS